MGPPSPLRTAAAGAPARVQFPLWVIMLLIATVAIGIAAPPLGVVALGMAPTAAAYAGSAFLVRTGRLRLAKQLALGLGLGFNGLFIASTLIPIGLEFQPAFYVGYFVAALPLIFGFGSAWATLERRHGEDSRHSPSPPWLTMGVLLGVPLFTLTTLWPLHAFFLMARPAMDRMADQAAAGPWGALSMPAWIGPFRVVATRMSSDADGVALITDPHPAGPAGFVRLRPGDKTGAGGRPIIAGDRLLVPLWGGWSYRMED
ncbi:hypothetical protein OJF2_48860 [Aquisphaera giovannonii]|uniref:Uncharacterized protein n=1 Tax=Aquisphaera giovannonii TaxID=406548 RepID=A0A5B9W8B9_9BACT|nr:hypothetical protein [Aquisphaera giovannonii]QEH36325.1 hypothetical protein OJF2_48860 [Aquisphaera giovannonii]